MSSRDHCRSEDYRSEDHRSEDHCSGDHRSRDHRSRDHRSGDHRSRDHRSGDHHQRHSKQKNSKRDYNQAFGDNGKCSGHVIVGNYGKTVVSSKQKPKRRKVASEVAALLKSTPKFTEEEPFVLKFGDTKKRENFHTEYKATSFQDRQHAWKMLKEELPRNMVAFLNCQSGVFELFFGIGDTGHVIGIWLTAEQKQKLPEQVNQLLRAKINRLVLQSTDFTLESLRVNPDQLAPITQSRLYVLKFTVQAKNPTQESHLFATRKSEDTGPEGYLYFLRVGCAQLFRLSKTERQDLIAGRTEKKGAA